MVMAILHGNLNVLLYFAKYFFLMTLEYCAFLRKNPHLIAEYHPEPDNGPYIPPSREEIISHWKKHIDCPFHLSLDIY